MTSPTIRDVAKAANVSVATASLVLNQKAGSVQISVRTRERVLQAAQEVGYVPNMAARRLRGNAGRTVTIAVLWPVDTRVGLIGRILTGIQEHIRTISEPRVELMVETYESGRLRDVRGLVEASTFNGAILANTTREDDAYIHSLDPAVPVVLFHRHSQKYPYVTADNFGAGCEMARQLTAHGHEQLTVLVPDVSSQAIQDRVHGIVHFLHSAPDAPRHSLIYCPFHEVGGYEAVMQLVQSGLRPTALLCLSDQVAMGALCALNTCGMKVPEHCEVIGFDNQEFTQFTVPSLSTVDLPVETMAAQAADMLLQKILHPSQELMSIEHPLRIVHRDTTRQG
ncbi:LacI family DNA-binding transcriptional regulator [Alicyclobacillus macrosporangiidus]|uniref:LacI family transcriptional regulator n=1 Tax=Alicyclobacillus macrosporangiidus TaxID=392015 RepID=A0A1I7F9V3_9BACL|nr:LacI family DNA-binding transcriptional regulator [Alicyclobacillus macrosporangiidus]SFU32972.1 LacI family transcriptional regulator [Alicyclobacillus macrosporangiidus]